MKSKLSNWFSLLIGCLACLPSANAQEVQVLNFEQLRPFLEKNNDTTYVINFWATWCKPCVEEMHLFEKLNETTGSRPVKIILVSLDFKNQIKSKLIPYIKAHPKLPEVIVLSDPDSNTWIPKVDKNWGGAIPVTLVYQRSKRKFREDAFENFEDLTKFLHPFIKL